MHRMRVRTCVLDMCAGHGYMHVYRHVCRTCAFTCACTCVSTVCGRHVPIFGNFSGHADGAPFPMLPSDSI